MVERSKKRGEFLWPRMLMKKWLNIKSGGDEFSADEFSADEHEDTESECEDENNSDSEETPDNRRSRFESVWAEMPETSSDAEDAPCDRKTRFASAFSESPGRNAGDQRFLKRGRSETCRSQYIGTEEIRVVVGTWNVAGRAPPPDLDLDEWLDMSCPADIYVLGFQEIVPLNAGNVLGAENNGPAVKWQALIRQTLNKAKHSRGKCHSAPPSPFREETSETSDILLVDPEVDVEHVVLEEDTSFVPLESPELPSYRNKLDQMTPNQKVLKGVYSSSERIGLNWSIQRTESEPAHWLSEIASTVMLLDENGVTEGEPLRKPLLTPLPKNDSTSNKCGKNRVKYVRIASKRMVGIHLSVWMRKKLRQYVHNLTVSCVGIGLMGYLGNKGSISISMTLHQTSFCFVCTHLASGDKEGDEIRRNADATEILRRTHFPPPKSSGLTLPETILGHDRIIWLGDLNYRLNISDSEARLLVAKKEWESLLERDQLRKEFRRGRVFDGWHEGTIYFAPTYKYEKNSDRYFGENAKPGEKRRTPAWCDRILWRGKCLKKVSYVRVESRLSDHRPVKADFVAEVEVLSERKLQKALSFKNAKVAVEELLSQTQTEFGYRKVDFEEVV